MIAQVIQSSDLPTTHQEGRFNNAINALNSDASKPQLPAQAEAEAEETSIQLSEQALQLSQNLSDKKPDWQQVQALASQLSTNLDSLFLKAGIDTSQPIRINIHPYTGMPFVGEHPDKNRIQTLLDDTPNLLQQIKNVNAVASYSYQVSQSMHGVSSLNATDNSHTFSANPVFKNTPGPALQQYQQQQTALGFYEQNTGTTRVAVEYRQDTGVALDIIAPGKNAR